MKKSPHEGSSNFETALSLQSGLISSHRPRYFLLICSFVSPVRVKASVKARWVLRMRHGRAASWRRMTCCTRTSPFVRHRAGPRRMRDSIAAVCPGSTPQPSRPGSTPLPSYVQARPRLHPSLLVLDEPTSRLDSTAVTWLVATLALKGRTVVASVHQSSKRGLHQDSGITVRRRWAQIWT
jgi:hypothetical protein